LHRNASLFYSSFDESIPSRYAITDTYELLKEDWLVIDKKLPRP